MDRTLFFSENFDWFYPFKHSFKWKDRKLTLCPKLSAHAWAINANCPKD